MGSRWGRLVGVTGPGTAHGMKRGWRAPLRSPGPGQSASLFRWDTRGCRLGWRDGHGGRLCELSPSASPLPRFGQHRRDQRPPLTERQHVFVIVVLEPDAGVASLLPQDEAMSANPVTASTHRPLQARRLVSALILVLLIDLSPWN